MYVRLPDDYKFPAISPEQLRTSPITTSTDAADVQHGESPFAETLSESVTDDADAVSVSRRDDWRPSSSCRRSPSPPAAHLHLPRFQRRRTTRRRVTLTSSFVSAANTDTDSGLYCV